MSMQNCFVTLLIFCITMPLFASAARGDDLPTSRAAKAAIQRYFAEVHEIDKVANLRKAEARQHLEKALDENAKFQANQKGQGGRYRGMLGYYSLQAGRVPFVMLSVPNGENVFGEYAKRVMNGRLDLSQRLYSFHTQGHVMIPRDGTYHLEASRGHWDVKLNGLGYSLSRLPNNRYAADVELHAGVYEVKFSVGNNGGQLPEAAIRIVDKASQQDLPIFVYESELDTFWRDLQFGVELIETSKWTRKENRLPAK